MRFLNLYLFSEKERSALSLSFGTRPAIIQARNGFGKSAVIKSLYECLGATPHKIDDSWMGANVISLLHASILDSEYFFMKAFDTYGIFDSRGSLIFRTQHKTKELGPFLAELLNFRLLMATRDNDTITPPPSYIFAPYYVDQDHGWLKPWTSFKDFYLPKSPPTLAEYHSGIKSNAYYAAQAERDRLALEARELDLSRRGLDQAIQEFIDSAAGVALHLDVPGFELEREKLIVEADILRRAQTANRAAVAAVAEERYLWHEQTQILISALAEIDSDFAKSLAADVDVECPACGSHYSNSIIERFSLVEDKDALLTSLATASANLSTADARLGEARRQLAAVETSLAKVGEILTVVHDGLSYKEVVAAEGRNEAIRLLRNKLDALDATYAGLQRAIERQKGLMDEAANPRRAREIRQRFSGLMTQFCFELDVRIQRKITQPIHSAGKTRGSEGVREILAYYFAFLHVSADESSAIRCPIVIDAPNQQGQDELHLPQIFKFILDRCPANAQLVVAVEDATAFESADVDIIQVGEDKRKVLRSTEYASVAEVIRPFLAELFTPDPSTGILI